MSAREREEQLPDWLERAWVERYLDRLLSHDEAAWFEAYVLDKPRLLDLIEADSRLRDAIADKDIVAENITAEPARQMDDIRSKSLRPMPWPWAAAASLVIGLGAGVLIQRREGSNESRNGAEPRFSSDTVMANPTRLVFDTMRGTSGAPLIEHGDSHTPYVLIEVAVPPTAENVVLELAGGEKSALSISADGFASFLLSRSAMDSAKSVVVHYKLDGKKLERDIVFKRPQTEGTP